MKTTVHLDRPAPALRPSTIRLGLIVSLVAATCAVVVRSLTHVPTAVIVAVVMIFGSTLSWHAAGSDARRPT